MNYDVTKQHWTQGQAHLASPQFTYLAVWSWLCGSHEFFGPHFSWENDTICKNSKLLPVIKFYNNKDATLFKAIFPFLSAIRHILIEHLLCVGHYS